MSELQSSALHADQAWMKQAIALALQGQYSTKPNPNVGCVIVKDGLLLGTGYHPKAGKPCVEPSKSAISFRSPFNIGSS